MKETTEKHFISIWKGIKKFIAWVTICILFGAFCFEFATIKELRASNNDVHMADRIEKGQTFIWGEWEVTSKKRK